MHEWSATLQERKLAGTTTRCVKKSSLSESFRFARDTGLVQAGTRIA
jgi:hypothetical protein